MARELLGNLKGPPGEVTNEQLEELHINVKRFGAIGDGVSDDTQAIKDTITYAESLGSHTPVYMPHGVYKTTDTIALSNPLYAHDSTINYNGTDTALVVGDESSPGKVTARKKFTLPRVINRLRGNDGWDGTSVGVRCVNLNTCELYVPFIQDFETGLLMYGYSQGCTYNAVSLGALWDNHKNLVMESNDTGWSNQTLFLNGRLQQSLNRGAFENDPDANQILLGGGGVELTSNNTFINTSIEGNNVAKYRLDVSGSYNHFYNLRNETHSDFKPKVIYRHNTFRNHIQGGFHMHLMEEVFEGNSTGGTIDDTRAIHFISKINELQVSKSTEYTTLNSFVSTGHRFKVEENGDFILRPGLWEITVVLNYQSTNGGAYYSRILKNGSLQASKISIPNPTYQMPFSASAIIEIKPGDVVNIQTRQSTDSESLRLNGTAFSSVTGKYLGGNI